MAIPAGGIDLRNSESIIRMGSGEYRNAVTLYAEDGFVIKVTDWTWGGPVDVRSLDAHLGQPVAWMNIEPYFMPERRRN